MPHRSKVAFPNSDFCTTDLFLIFCSLYTPLANRFHLPKQTYHCIFGFFLSPNNRVPGLPCFFDPLSQILLKSASFLSSSLKPRYPGSNYEYRKMFSKWYSWFCSARPSPKRYQSYLINYDGWIKLRIESKVISSNMIIWLPYSQILWYPLIDWIIKLHPQTSLVANLTSTGSWFPTVCFLLPVQCC